MQDFAGRCIVVTGAGGGMGRSIALTLAEAGSNIVVADIESDAAESVAAEVAALGVDAVPVVADVADCDSVQRLANRAFAKFERVDVLCNNAGVTLRPFRSISNTSLEDFRWIMGTNFWGVVHGVKAFLPRMRDQTGAKHIVNTSSLATQFAVAGHSAYSASKTAVDGFSDVLRAELADENFGVTILYPGAVRTRILTSERLRPDSEKSANRNVPAYYSEYIRSSRANNSEIEADTVGPMVRAAIEANAP